MKNLEHVFPFLWLKGEEQSLLLDEIIAIKNSGVNAFCLESRIHPDFGKEGWFADVEFALREAKKRDMQVWILDDFSYPTGYARGMIAKERPDLKGWQIAAPFIDLSGEVRNAKIPLPLEEKNGDTLLGVFMAKRGYDRVLPDTVVEITDRVKEGILYTPIPYGNYRVYFLIKTQGYPERDHYIDMLNPASTDYFLDVVYGEHYRRLAPYFGDTLVGFFSDEPRLCNGFSCKSLYFKPVTFCETGEEGVAYPYSDALSSRLGIQNPAEWLRLWTEDEGFEGFRCAYMTEITKLYRENFNGKLSAWCHAHGIAYAGHIIEDNGAHLRTICSAGHYFRAMDGADLSGVDIVLHQIKPYDTETKHRAPSAGGYADGTFFCYLLAKLAASSAALDECKKGKALCEVFGAYGWRESTKEMLYLVNHLLASGINYFIPHAFSMGEKDVDCPPHFYMRGKNPAYEGYGVLFRYMDKMGELFSDGASFADVAVLYHDEAEWSGRAYEPCEKLAKLLTQNQIDFDVVYREHLHRARLTPEGIALRERRYRYILVPDSEYLTPETLALLEGLQERVLYLGRFPVKGKGRRVKKSALIEFLHEGGVPRSVEKGTRGLRLYRYEKNESRYAFCFNESGKTIRFSFAEKKDVYAVDTATGEVLFFEGGENITLAPAQAILFGSFAKGWYKPYWQAKKKVKQADVYLKGNEETQFTFYKRVNFPFDINALEENPEFCGEICYRFTIDCYKTQALTVDYDGEFCRVEIDGRTQTTVGGRALVDLSKERGKKEISLTFANTLAYKVKNESFSSFTYIPACCVYSITY